MTDAPSSGLPDFDALAETYERLAEPLTGPLARQALALADLPPGASVIDVAAGTGALALPAAEAGHRVLAVDLAPGMVARVAPKLARHPGCEARIGDCTKLDVPDAGFDAAFSIFGVAILPVWRAGLAEMRRVTRAGGRIVLGAWPGEHGAKPMVVLGETFARLFPGRPFWATSEFPPWTEQTLRDALREAGCREAAVHRVETTYLRPSAKVLVEESSPFFRFVPEVKALASAEAARLDVALVEAFGAYAAADGSVHLPVEALVAVGTVG